MYICIYICKVDYSKIETASYEPNSNSPFLSSIDYILYNPCTICSATNQW